MPNYDDFLEAKRFKAMECCGGCGRNKCICNEPMEDEENV